MDEPTRDDLLADNARLRRELERSRRGAPMWPVLGGLAAHIVLRPFLDPWLNADSDAKAGAAAVILGVPVAFSLFMLRQALR